jgi:hypothetical protein
MATQNDDTETPEQTRARKIIGWHRAAADAEPLLEFAGAQSRIVTSDDVGKTVADMVYALLNAKRDQLEQE